MKHEYDLFEKFPDGSSLWRDSVPGFKTARLRLQELAHVSKNQFYAINLANGVVVTVDSSCDIPGVRAALKTERRTNSHAA